ncbi:MAG: IS66 family insertion sequence element accessory protein TnpB [Accumulibacter sp.]|jgi:hypothetical protein|uniref:IS66 family insertion sequence element accessory protein TnpB n=1 Tax=Accumulibacter sp. TaxID=2053492 RepID=UPI002FC2A951
MLIGPGVAVYVVKEAIDMRKSIDGLATKAQDSLQVSPLLGSLFVFFNRGCDKVKLLWWDRHSFWLAYKRLAQGRFRLPNVRAFPNWHGSSMDCISQRAAWRPVGLEVWKTAKFHNAE